MQGKTINGYTLQRQLGVGGMAEVWLAENAIGKKAAVKLLLSKFCQDEAIVARFENEAKVMVQLDHPNIRQVYDYGNIDGRPTIIMEYLEGDDLKAMMKQGRHFTNEELVKWWNQIADALNYTHAKGIVHRDIKPSNIFIDKKGNVKLLDFGIAKIKESISMTQTGAMMGTLMYMSPEQVEDSKHIGPQSDIYSLAVTFVHLLTGRAPYDSTTTSDYAIRKGIVEQPLDLSLLPKDCQGFLAPYLEKDPAKRPVLRPFVAMKSGSLMPNDDENEEDDATEISSNNDVINKPLVTEGVMPEQKKGNKRLWYIIAAVVVVIVVALFVFLPSSQEVYFFSNVSDVSLWVDGDSIQLDRIYKLSIGEHVYKATKIGYEENTGTFRVNRQNSPQNVYVMMEEKVMELDVRCCGDFHEGLAVVGVRSDQNYKYGLIDYDGNVVIMPQYDNIDITNGFSDGLAAVQIDGQWGFINHEGNIVITPRYSRVHRYSEGAAAVELDSKWGVIDKSGNIIVNFVYDYIGEFHEGMIDVAIGKGMSARWGFVDKSGKLIIKPQYKYGVSDFSEDLASVWNDKDRKDYINKQGDIIIGNNYYFGLKFSDGLAAVRNETGKWGFINKYGELIIGYQYDLAYSFSEDLAAVAIGHEYDNSIKWGYIDKGGNLIVDFQYDFADGFSEGLARVERNNKYFFIDKDGNKIGSEYSFASDFSEGYAWVKDGGKYKFIDKSGNVVFSFK